MTKMLFVNLPVSDLKASMALCRFGRAYLGNDVDEHVRNFVNIERRKELCRDCSVPLRSTILRGWFGMNERKCATVQ